MWTANNAWMPAQCLQRMRRPRLTCVSICRPMALIYAYICRDEQNLRAGHMRHLGLADDVQKANSLLSTCKPDLEIEALPQRAPPNGHKSDRDAGHAQLSDKQQQPKKGGGITSLPWCCCHSARPSAASACICPYSSSAPAASSMAMALIFLRQPNTCQRPRQVCQCRCSVKHIPVGIFAYGWC